MNREEKISLIYKIASIKNGEVVELKSLTDILFKCKNGHEFKKIFAELNHGRWCPKCAKLDWHDPVRELQKERVVNIINGFDCKIIDLKYNTQSDKVKYECKNGHLHIVPAKYILSKKFVSCSRCSVNEKKIQNTEFKISLKGGKILDYDRGIFKIQCKNNHKWKMGSRALKRAIREGRGCPRCNWINKHVKSK